MKFDENIKREIIMDNYQKPSHHGLKKTDDYIYKHMASDSCIDDIHVELKIEDGIIKDGNFEGVACAISTSSTSILLSLIVGKTIDEAKKIIENYELMIDGKEYDDDLLEDANAFDTLYKQANRINCGLIGLRGIKKIIEEGEKKHG